jgi:hypothetical protein
MLYALLVSFALAGSPYSPARGQNAPVALEASAQDDGTVVYKAAKGPAPADGYGNAAGNQYDLVVDGAFEGQTVVVLQLYTDPAFDFSLPKAALQEKGFSVVRWANGAPPEEEFIAALGKACQLWVIADDQRHLTDGHVAAIRTFFDAGHGVYIWGDNEPFYTDANVLAKALFGGEMTGNLPGTQTVNVRRTLDGPGLQQGHDITTGLEHLYEGITIATVQPNDSLQPLVVGSAGNLVTAVYEHNGKRAVFDGGFTRLYVQWDTAGTARYVKNAAAWLVNYERFGDGLTSAR